MSASDTIRISAIAFMGRAARCGAAAAAFGLLSMASTPALADDYPSKPIRVIVPFNAGSGSDSGSRIYGEMLSKRIGQPVIVENRPGASGLLAIQAVKSAPPDGYTVMLASNSPMAVNPVVMKDLPYDPFKDFKPVIGITVGPAAIVVRADSPYKTVKDLFEGVKKEKRPLMVGNYSAGYQLIGTWLGTVGGVEVAHVPYKGGAQALTDIIGGQIDTAAIDFSGVVAMLQEGRVRALATTGGKRHKLFPDVPTMIESGYPDFETYVWSSWFVRSEVPAERTEKLARAMLEVLESKEAYDYRATLTGEPLNLILDDMRAFQLKEFERFKRVAEAAGLKPQ